METKVKTIDVEKMQPEDLEEAVEILQSGGLVAFPTETVYGLGGNALDEFAAKKIYEAKGRPSDNPLIVHISNSSYLHKLAREIPDKVSRLAEAFWPGPLTIILKKKEQVPDGTTGGLDTVAVRMPDHKLALALIEQSGVMIAAPSANVSGRPSPTKAEHVKEDLNGKINMILDGGMVGIGLESTILDLTEEIPVILRPGAITQSMLEAVIGTVAVDKGILKENQGKELKPKAPGMKYKHYAPTGQLFIVEGKTKDIIDYINKQIYQQEQKNKRIGVICTDETRIKYKGKIVKSIGTRQEEGTIARRLYDLLREFDTLGVEIIYSESFYSNELGQAIMNRLLKAAGYQVIKVS